MRSRGCHDHHATDRLKVARQKIGPSQRGIKQHCGACVCAFSGVEGALWRASAKFLHVCPDARTDEATHQGEESDRFREGLITGNSEL